MASRPEDVSGCNLCHPNTDVRGDQGTAWTLVARNGQVLVRGQLWLGVTGSMPSKGTAAPTALVPGWPRAVCAYHLHHNPRTPVSVSETHHW